MKIESLKKLYVHELKDLYSAETQIEKSLPRMIEAADDDGLKNALWKHLEETKGHVSRLEKIFEDLEFSQRGHRCKGMAGLIEEAEDVLEDVEGSDVADARDHRMRAEDRALRDGRVRRRASLRGEAGGVRRGRPASPVPRGGGRGRSRTHGAGRASDQLRGSGLTSPGAPPSGKRPPAGGHRPHAPTAHDDPAARTRQH